MYDRIRQNLVRQFKGLELLHALLQEEFECLCRRDTDAVSALEFSIHELLRQIAVERLDIKKTMQETRLVDYAALLPEDEGREIMRLYHLIDGLEQHCSRQATHNAELSLALLDQSHELMVFLHRQIAPKQSNCYGAQGRMRDERPGAAIYSGRL